MARFIIDIANVNEGHYELMESISDAIIKTNKTSDIVTINCIEETNDGQFYDKHVKVNAEIWS